MWKTGEKKVLLILTESPSDWWLRLQDFCLALCPIHPCPALHSSREVQLCPDLGTNKWQENISGFCFLKRRREKKELGSLVIPSRSRNSEVSQHLLWPKQSQKFFFTLPFEKICKLAGKTAPHPFLRVSGSGLGLAFFFKWTEEKYLSCLVDFQPSLPI